MMLTTKARYAVTAMVDIAVLSGARAAGGKTSPIKLGEIAERQKIPLNYLEQIFAKLKTRGLITSIKGPGGGYVIANGANHTKVLDIIDAVEESIEMTNCGREESSACAAGRARCATHDLWEGLTENIRGYLGAVTLAELANKNSKKTS